MNKLNFIFWLMFVAIGVVIVIGVVGRLFLMDLIIGLIVIIMGVARLSEELSKLELYERHEKIDRDLEKISRWMGDNYSYTKRLRDVHENRMHRLDSKRADTERDLELRYRELVRKIIDIENRLQDISKHLAAGLRDHGSEEQVRSGRGRD